jgi:4-aminobutyrate aminotransferase-like enzyme
MALTTSKVIYKQHFGPFMPGVHIAPYPYCLHCKVQAEKVRGSCYSMWNIMPAAALDRVPVSSSSDHPFKP